MPWVIMWLEMGLRSGLWVWPNEQYAPTTATLGTWLGNNEAQDKRSDYKEK